MPFTLAAPLLAAIVAGAPAQAARPEPLAARPPEGEVALDEAAFAPRFTGPAAEAVLRLREDKPAAALKLLPAAPTDAPTRYLKALALAGTGAALEAAKSFEALAADFPPLRGRCLVLAAGLRADLGNLDLAARSYEAALEDPVHGREARFGLARVLARAGKRDRAVELLQPLARAARGDAPSWARVDAAWQVAQLLEESGQTAAALEAYQRLHVQEPLSAKAGDARNRARALAAKLKVPALPDALLVERIDRMVSANQIKAAKRELAAVKTADLCGRKPCGYTRCQAAAPSAAVAAAAKPAAAPAAEAASADAEAPADESVEPGDEAAAPEGAPRRAAAFAVAAAKDDEDAFDEPRALPACAVWEPARPADPLVCRVQLLRGIVARKSRELSRAVELLRPVYERCADADVRARALHTAQSAAGSLGDADAADLGLLLALQFKTHPLADDALLLAANRAREAGNRVQERSLLRGIVRWLPEGDQHAEALFRLFWSHRADGRPDRGLPYLAQLWRLHDRPKTDGADAERGRYWWGRTVTESARPEDRPLGVRTLQQLAADRPLTYYGLLAGSLGESNALTPALAKAAATVQPAVADAGEDEGSADGLRPGWLATDAAFQQAHELLRLGFVEQARDALRLVDFKRLRADGARGRESVLLVAELVSRCGDVRGAHHLVRQELLGYIRRADGRLTRRASRLAYPLAFRAQITEHAPQQGLPPDFLQGLMREESALDPRARSPVGARGLTQVMPATARQVARSIGLRRFKVDSLWDPDTNIRIGSVYLGRMLKKFGHPGLAAAAYNAGPGAVSRWMAARGEAALDEFVEDIPFSETRGYVKRVLRSWAAYKHLYDEGKGPQVRVSLAIPRTIGSEL